MNLDELLRALRADTKQLTIPKGWSQGRATFGGLVAGVLLERMTEVVDPKRRARSASCTFVKPVSPGSVEVRTEILRAGTALTTVQGALLQKGEVVLTCTASFGEIRDSSLYISPVPAPKFLPADSIAPMRIDGAPELVHNFDHRLVVGGAPASGTNSRDVGGWVRLREGSEPVSMLHVMSLLDGWPPPPFCMVDRPIHACSLSWLAHFIEPDFTQSSSDWWKLLISSETTSEGYSSLVHRLWDGSDSLVALCHEVFVDFA